jgi:hypothetical protein
MDFSMRNDGSLAVTAVEEIETVAGKQTLYAWITDVPGLDARNILGLVHATGRDTPRPHIQPNSESPNAPSRG